jgi:hypothetical protein
MPKFMFILHHTPGSFERLPPEQQGHVFERYRNWVEQIRAGGRYVVSDKLREEGGKLVSLERGRVTVVDGPYAETKEVVGGYFTIRADSYEEAVAIARECPFLERGTIAVRQTDPGGCGDD